MRPGPTLFDLAERAEDLARDCAEVRTAPTAALPRLLQRLGFDLAREQREWNFCTSYVEEGQTFHSVGFAEYLAERREDFAQALIRGVESELSPELALATIEAEMRRTATLLSERLK